MKFSDFILHVKKEKLKYGIKELLDEAQLKGDLELVLKFSRVGRFIELYNEYVGEYNG